MMYSELKSLSKPEQERRLEKYILCYDNICNVDALAAAKEKLPLPEPLDDLWTKAKKVIDRLHIKNHKDKRCHEIYSPDSLPESYNTMAGEQTFAWMSRFKKIVNSMTQTHHLFYLHRMCIRRNRYTSSCLQRNREPVLPGINKALHHWIPSQIRKERIRKKLRHLDFQALWVVDHSVCHLLVCLVINVFLLEVLGKW